MGTKQFSVISQLSPLDTINIVPGIVAKKGVKMPCFGVNRRKGGKKWGKSEMFSTKLIIFV